MGHCLNEHHAFRTGTCRHLSAKIIVSSAALVLLLALSFWGIFIFSGQKHAGVLSKQVSIDLSEGRYDDAMRHASELWWYRPNHYSTYLMFADICMYKGQPRTAVRYYTKAISRNGYSVHMHLCRAEAFRQSGDLAALRADLDRAVELTESALRQHNADDRHSPVAYLSRAALFWSQGRYADAKADLAAAASKFPADRANLETLMAQFLSSCPDHSVRDPQEAVRLAERALRLPFSDEPKTSAVLAMAWAAAGEFTSATALLRAQLALPRYSRSRQAEELLGLFASRKTYECPPTDTHWLYAPPNFRSNSQSPDSTARPLPASQALP